jgi:hypothetical protein
MLQVVSISQLTVGRLSRQCGILNISQPYRPPCSSFCFPCYPTSCRLPSWFLSFYPKDRGDVFSMTSVDFQRTTRRNIQEHRIIQSHRCAEILTVYVVIFRKYGYVRHNECSLNERMMGNSCQKTPQFLMWRLYLRQPPRHVARWFLWIPRAAVVGASHARRSTSDMHAYLRVFCSYRACALEREWSI